MSEGSEWTPRCCETSNQGRAAAASASTGPRCDVYRLRPPQGSSHLEQPNQVRVRDFVEHKEAGVHGEPVDLRRNGRFWCQGHLWVALTSYVFACPPACDRASYTVTSTPSFWESSHAAPRPLIPDPITQTRDITEQSARVRVCLGLLVEHLVGSVHP
jgi:hypothetical protein